MLYLYNGFASQSCPYPLTSRAFAGRRITSRQSMRFLRTTLTLAAMGCALASPAFAQDTFDAPPPHLAIVDGTVTLDREDVTEPATGGVPMVPGDRLRTERGRAELLFPDGSALDLDEYTTIELEGPTLMRMTSGRVILFAAGSSNPATALQFQIDTPVASAQTDAPGEYRITMIGAPSRPQTEMAIVRGSGALVTDAGTMPLGSGERSVAGDNAAPSRPQLFNSARYDAFDQWAMALRDERLGSRSQSAQYLPADLRIYGGELDRHGAWDYEAPYGYVWYPTVAPEWRPYYDGYWSSVPSYGWTWIGVDVWSWPTHHYGRWGYGRNRWFWIPDRRWSPAWVSWGDAPGYVSWCPLGFDNRPVFSLSVSIGNSWRGWTVLSRDHFGGRRNVNQFAVSPRSLPRNVGFVAQRSAPVPAPRAVRRGGPGNGGQFAGDRRQFPNVFGSTTDGRPGSAVSRRGNGDRPAQGQVTQGRGPATITRSPQAASRQPQGIGRQPQVLGQSPRSDPGRFGDRPQAVPRQRQAPSAQTSPNGDRADYVGQNRGATRTLPPDTRTTDPVNRSDRQSNSARPRFERPSVPQAPAQPIAPAAPQRSDRPQYGTATRRSEPIRPIQPAQPDGQRPEFSRRGNGSNYAQRPTAPPAVAPPPAQPAPQRQERQEAPPRQERQQAAPRQERQPAPQREERASQPRQERQSEQGRSRGHENQQSSSDGQQSGGGHHRR
jgi:uncharacterized protein DUF6600/FecR-like protein